MSRAVIYTRVSTKDQVDNNSLATQEARCRAHCKRHGFDPVRVFREEGESAKTANRTEFKRMRTFATSRSNRISYVVVLDVSRFARDLYDQLHVERELAAGGVELHCVLGTNENDAHGRAMRGFAAVMAQMDNQLKAEKTVDGMRAAARNGKWLHQPVLGYRRGDPKSGPSLVQDEDAAAWVRRAYDLFSTGNIAVEPLAEKLTLEGMTSRLGKRIRPQTLHRMLIDSKYIARFSSKSTNGDEVEGDWQPIIEREKFDRVQRVFATRSRTKAPRRKTRPDFPLKGHVRCGTCSGCLTGGMSRGRNGARYPYYRCHTCGGVQVRAEKLHAKYRELLTSLTPSKTMLDAFADSVLEAWNHREQAHREARTMQRKRLEAIEQKRSRVLEMRMDHEIDVATFSEKDGDLRRQREEAQEALRVLDVHTVDADVVARWARQNLTDLERVWCGASLDQRLALQRVVHPNGVHYFDEKFGTGEIASVFQLLKPATGAGFGLASPEGFEPS